MKKKREKIPEKNAKGMREGTALWRERGEGRKGGAGGRGRGREWREGRGEGRGDMPRPYCPSPF